MSRLIERVPIEEPVPLRLKRVKELETWLTLEVTDALAAHAGRDKQFRHLIDQYDGKPENEWSMDAVPIKQVEVTLGAIAADSLSAQAYATLFGANPPVSCRGNEGYEQAAKHFQTLANHLAVESFVNFKPAGNEMILDCTQLGTGCLYPIWVDDIKNTGLTRMVARGPRLYSISPENLIYPGGQSTFDPTMMRLFGLRTYYTDYELKARARMFNWKIEKALPSHGTTVVQRERDRVAQDRNSERYRNPVFEILHMYVYFDIDGDGLEEDLYVVYDKTSQLILWVGYNGFDNRPFVVSRYQVRPHKFEGLGVLEMASPYQQAGTDWFNFNTANAKLANSRFVAVKWGSPLAGSKLRLMPNKPIYLQDPGDILFTQAAELYPSSIQREMLNWQLVDKRTGMNTALQQGAAPGKRTPATTAMTIMQQINQRFSPAFGSMRDGLGEGIVQCIERMKEMWQADEQGSKQYIHEYLTKVVGARGASQIEKVFADATRDLRDCIIVEMTAATQSINREADRQAGMQVLQVLNQYYAQMMQMAMLAGNPQTPPPVKAMIAKIVPAATEALDRILRTYDQIRDPALFLINQEEFGGLANGGPAAMGNEPQEPGNPGEPAGMAGSAAPGNAGPAGGLEDLGGNPPPPGGPESAG